MINKNSKGKRAKWNLSYKFILSRIDTKFFFFSFVCSSKLPSYHFHGNTFFVRHSLPYDGFLLSSPLRSSWNLPVSLCLIPISLMVTAHKGLDTAEVSPNIPALAFILHSCDPQSAYCLSGAHPFSWFISLVVFPPTSRSSLPSNVICTKFSSFILISPPNSRSLSSFTRWITTNHFTITPKPNLTYKASLFPASHLHHVHPLCTSFLISTTHSHSCLLCYIPCPYLWRIWQYCGDNTVPLYILHFFTSMVSFTPFPLPTCSHAYTELSQSIQPFPPSSSPSASFFQPICSLA